MEGSITVRNSKNQRITFIRCENDLNSLIDLSKVVDIALLMIDASVGFELETFEFISMMKNHGYTNVFGVLSHMDSFAQNKSLGKLKREIKKRFQREASDKAKLFYIYGIQNGFYPKIQIHNLARYLRIIKPISLPFREKHPYIYCDKYFAHLDSTHQNNKLKESGIRDESKENDVTVSFFGYIRGGHFNKYRTVYINGLGDFDVDMIKSINDPCPYEIVEKNGVVKRTLREKQNTLFAPWCKINNIEFDKKDGFITIPERFVTLTRKAGEDTKTVTEGVKMIREMHNSKKIINEDNMEVDDEMNLGTTNPKMLEDFKDKNNTKSKLNKSKPRDIFEEEEDEDYENNDAENDDDDDEEDDMELIQGMKVSGKVLEDKKTAKLREKNLALEKAPHTKFNDILNTFKKINKEKLNYQETYAEALEREIYGDESTNDTIASSNLQIGKGGSRVFENDDDFIKVKSNRNTKKKDFEIEFEITKDNSPIEASLKSLIKAARKKLRFDIEENEEEPIEEELDEGEEEDDANKFKKSKDRLLKKGINLKAIEEDISSDDDDKFSKLKKQKKKDEEIDDDNSNLDKELDPEEKKKLLEEEEAKNKESKEFFSEDYGYYKLGTYVRIDVKGISHEIIERFSSRKPIILCSVDIQEQAMSFMKLRLEKHLYYPKVLKSGDPLIYSIGWRRFQTTATLCVEDKHRRLRHIKYTPKFGPCLAISYGPVLPVYLRVIAFQSTNPKLPHFRICATGDLLEHNQSFQVMKKLKLIGEPFKIEKKTAFIKGMFNSSMEVARYIGAEIKTVSGIRGQIKKQENNVSQIVNEKIKEATSKSKSNENEDEEFDVVKSVKDGCFRATFEDRILRSDIVFLITWHQIPLSPYYNPITDYRNNRLLKTTSEVRAIKGIMLEQNKDSDYKEIVRPDRVFPKLVISKVSLHTYNKYNKNLILET